MKNKIIGGIIAVVIWDLIVIILYFQKISFSHLGFLPFIVALLGMYLYPKLIIKVENKEEKNFKYYWRLPFKTLIDLIIVFVLANLLLNLVWGLVGFAFPHLPSVTKIISSSYGF